MHDYNEIMPRAHTCFAGEKIAGARDAAAAAGQAVGKLNHLQPGSICYFQLMLPEMPHKKLWIASKVLEVPI